MTLSSSRSFSCASSRSVPSAPLLGLLTLAALGLATVPAHAQTLSLGNGDSVTVTGSGTVGKISGAPVNNITTSYSDSGSSAVETNGTSTFTLGTGGSLAATGFGNPIGLAVNGSGAVAVTGGTISGGKYGYGLYDAGSGPVTISGGSLSGGSGGLDVYTTGPVTISGGSITGGASGYGLHDVQGVVTITGGTFSAGPGGVALFASTGSTIDLFSQNDSTFYINGIAMNNKTLTGSQYQSYGETITGTLENGDTLDTSFAAYGTINLNPGVTPPASTPEPSSLTVLAFGALGLSGLALKAKKRNVAA